MLTNNKLTFCRNVNLASIAKQLNMEKYVLIAKKQNAIVENNTAMKVSDQCYCWLVLISLNTGSAC